MTFVAWVPVRFSQKVNTIPFTSHTHPHQLVRSECESVNLVNPEARMAGFISRLVASLVAVVALLQLTHLVLLNKLESRRLAEIQHHEIIGSSPQAQAQKAGDRRTIDSFININGRQRRSQASAAAAQQSSQNRLHIITTERMGLDSTGEFRIIYNVGKISNSGAVSPSAEAMLNQAQTSSDSILVPITADTEADLGTEGAATKGSTLPGMPPANSNSYSNDDPNSDFDVTLVSGGDLTNARHYLISLVERWQGPISLTLYAHSASELSGAIEFINTLRICHALVKQHVSFHLVFPATEELPDLSPHLPSEPNFVQNLMPMMCQNFYKNLLPFVQEKDGQSPDEEPTTRKMVHKFPVNLLRNVARATVSTKYSFVIDIDLLPSQGLRPQFQEFIKSRYAGRRRRRVKRTEGQGPAPTTPEYETKVVFVVPAFETQNSETPSTKAELLMLLESYQARPYYFDLCWKCHVHTDYESWQRESPSSRNELSILFEVLWKDPWEPFFIADNHQVPLYDERFQNEYGYHRLSQLCELHMNGYKFAVLNDAFLIHPNFKTLEGMGATAGAGVGVSQSAVYPEDRSHNLEINRLHFVQFKNEMSQKYPQSSRSCY